MIFFKRLIFKTEMWPFPSIILQIQLFQNIILKSLFLSYLFCTCCSWNIFSIEVLFQLEMFLLFKSRIKTSSQFFQKIVAMVNMLLFKIWWIAKNYEIFLNIYQHWLNSLSRTYGKKEGTQKKLDCWLVLACSVKLLEISFAASP